MDEMNLSPGCDTDLKLERKIAGFPDLPPAPERPLDSDCCGEGCVPCVLDIYQQELKLWQEECARIMNGEVNDTAKLEVFPKEECLSPKHYKKFIITSISKEATNIIRVRFSLPPKQTLGLSLGQHVIIRFFNEEGISTTRQYTPVSPLSAENYFDLLIKIYSDGRASKIIKSWKEGDGIEMRGPAGLLNYRPNKYTRVLMLSAGTGVAPMFQVVHTILGDDKDDTYLRLIYATRDYSCIMGKEEISEWRRFWNFSCLFVLSQEPKDAFWQYKYGEEVLQGRLSEEMIRKELSSCQLNNVLVLVCGPRLFDTHILTCLRKIGLSDTNIHWF